jgi:hypothetical protein
MPFATKTPEINKKLIKFPIRTQASIQKTTRNFKYYTKLIDQKDNLQKMEYKLKRIVNPRPQNTA